MAEALGVPLEGLSRELRGAAPLDTARASDLTYAANPKSFAVALGSSAACLIVPPEYERPERQSVIRAASPRALFARALTLLYPQRAAVAGIHHSASVDAAATVDPTAEIGAFCSVGVGSVVGPETRLEAGVHVARNVHIGAHCILYPGVVLYDSTHIGNRVILHAGCIIGADGFGFTPQDGHWAKFPQVGHVFIEDDVEIGANSCIDRAALGRTRIGAGSKLDNMVHVGHNCDIGRHVVVAAQTGFSGGVTVGDGAIIGGQVGVGDKARIEAGVILGSGSGVLTSKMVRAGQPLWGTPARPLRAYLEQLAALNRLPEFRDELKALREEVDRLSRGSAE